MKDSDNNLVPGFLGLIFYFSSLIFFKTISGKTYDYITKDKTIEKKLPLNGTRDE